MRQIALLLVLLVVFTADALKYNYVFQNTPLSQALLKFGQDNPEINIAFIYRELDNYRTSAKVDSDEPYTALREIIGPNPITLIQKKNSFYIEALQKGKYIFRGNVAGSDEEALVGATVMLLAPKDSTVITYGRTDEYGRFSIPCDKKKVIAKVVCMGYDTNYCSSENPDLGTIVLPVKSIALKAVSVEAAGERLSPDKNTYIPTQKQKQFSQTGIDLLRHMAIPTLVVTPGSESVTDVFGNTCELFINYNPASPEDLVGLKIGDVHRIEILDAPSDLRFRGARKAINFIVQEYVYGGYSKVIAAETILNGFSNKSNLYSKFSFKKMTYDLYAGSSNSMSHHSYIDSRATYNLEQGSVKRAENTTAAKEVSNKIPVTFRATLKADKVQITNQVAYTHQSVPEKHQEGEVSYDSRPDLSYRFSRSNTDRTNSLKYSGSLYWIPGNDFAVDYSHNFSYDHRNTFSSYTNGAFDYPIDNPARENVARLNLNLFVLKAFGPTHKLRIGGGLAYTNDKVNYLNNSSFLEHLKTLTANGTLQYTYSSKSFRLVANIGNSFERITVNGKRHNENNPFGNINLQYMINSKNRISAYGYVAIWTPGIGMRQDAVTRSDEFMYLTGNSDLHNTKQLITNLAYNWAPSNKLSFAAFTGYSEYFNRIATVYTPYKGGTALLRGFVNDGNYQNAYIGAQGTLKLLNNSLQLYANVSQNIYRTTGIYQNTYYPIRLQLQASYYWKSFYALASWANPRGNLTENSNIIIRSSHSYGIEGGWGNGTWVVSLSAWNIFNTGWKSSTWERPTPLYSEWQNVYAPSAHANVHLSVTYTIGYGKKVRQGNEVGAQESGSSAILKP